jgi:hypothetical protein
MCNTAGLLTDRAEAAGPALVFALALAVLAAAPGAGELPPNADRLHHLEEAGAAAFAMLGQAPLQVLAGAQGVLGVLGGAIEVQQVYGHAAPPVESWSGTGCACSRRSRLQCCVTNPRSMAA